MLKHILIFLIVIAASCLPVSAQTKYAAREGDSDFRIPGELESFVESGMKIIAYAKVDLKKDGALDYIVVLQEISKSTEESFPDMSDRPVLIIVRGKDGKLSVGARNEKAVFCINCAGGTSDPLDEITIEESGFSITNRGGNRELWLVTYEFKYSRRDKTWLLTRVVEENYDGERRKTTWKKIYRSPKHFGKIKFADFDTDNFKGKGMKAPPQKKSPSGVKTQKLSVFFQRYDAKEKQ